MKKLRAKERVLALIRKSHKKGVGTAELVNKFGLSRQRVSLLLSQLVEDGQLSKEGSTKNARYFPTSDKEPIRSSVPSTLKLIKNLKGLEEDLVFREIALRLNLKQALSKNSFNILNYAFTEMLNNAIDHSGSKRTEIEVEMSAKSVAFQVKDAGIGAFEKIRSTFHLTSTLAAVEHLFKGKQTTDPMRHSGQGIFFTSRIADEFILIANGYRIRILGSLDDLLLSESKISRGTQVTFRISKQSKRSLEKLFHEYSNQDFEFDRDRIRVKLSNFEGLLSRSQAKRLLIGLDQFARIEFDFKGVDEIGQAFADEIFRVYSRKHPRALLSYTNANSAIAFLIERARKDLGSEK